MLTKLELFNGPPDDFIPGTFVNLYNTTGVNQIKQRYKSMKEPKNTPFQYVQSEYYSFFNFMLYWLTLLDIFMNLSALIQKRILIESLYEHGLSLA